MDDHERSDAESDPAIVARDALEDDRECDAAALRLYARGYVYDAKLMRDAGTGSLVVVTTEVRNHARARAFFRFLMATEPVKRGVISAHEALQLHAQVAHLRDNG